MRFRGTGVVLLGGLLALGLAAAAKEDVGTFAADFGPGKIDVSGYPKEQQSAYKLFARRCSKCHKLSRPINAAFLELSEAEQAKLKEESPEAFEDEKLLRIGSKVWNRYVKRMMRKPGCDIKPKEAKVIWEFLVYDGKQRKTGDNLKPWLAHRRKLLDTLKADYPGRYQELYGVEKKGE